MQRKLAIKTNRALLLDTESLREILRIDDDQPRFKRSRISHHVLNFDAESIEATFDLLLGLGEGGKFESVIR